MIGTYILIGQTPVPEPDFERWARWMGEYNEHVAFVQVGPYQISTIFLGLDHAHWPSTKVRLFETMIFADDRDDELHSRQWRCATWSEAEEQHALAVAACRAKIQLRK